MCKWVGIKHLLCLEFTEICPSSILLPKNNFWSRIYNVISYVRIPTLKPCIFLYERACNTEMATPELLWKNSVLNTYNDYTNVMRICHFSWPCCSFMYTLVFKIYSVWLRWLLPAAHLDHSEKLHVGKQIQCVSLLVEDTAVASHLLGWKCILYCIALGFVSTHSVHFWYNTGWSNQTQCDSCNKRHRKEICFFNG